MTRSRMLLILGILLLATGFLLGVYAYMFPGRLPNWLWILLVALGALGPLFQGLDAALKSLFGKSLVDLWRATAAPPPAPHRVPRIPSNPYSCFISCSSDDNAFAEKLHDDLEANGVDCWFAPHDMRIGDRIRSTIDRSIQEHDKLLLILSGNSIDSQWVEDEVEAAFERERQTGEMVLFPIRLDGTAMQTDEAWAATIRRTRHIGDFSNWRDPDQYQEAFDRLLQDLSA